MPETLTAPEQTKVENTNRPNEMTIQPNQLAGQMFNFEEPKKEEQVQTTPQITEPSKTEETKKEDEVIDADVWFKNEFGEYGWQDAETAKKDISEWKKAKETHQTKEELKYANDQSKFIHEALLAGKEDEILAYLSTKKKIEKFSNLNIEKPEDAAELLKAFYQLKYKDFGDEDVRSHFEDQYEKPQKPKQTADQEDADYQEVLDKWKAKCDAIDRKIIRDAKMAKPDFNQFTNQVVLPNIPKQEVQQKQPTQEELDAIKKYDEAYGQSVDLSIKDFNGFSVTVAKNEDVGLPELTISYGIVDTEKPSLGATMKEFSSVGYDANTLFAPRWVNEDRTLNTKKMLEDRYFLDNKEKILQKVTTDAATKAIEAFIKSKKQINVNENNQQGTATITKDGKTGIDLVRDQFFS